MRRELLPQTVQDRLEFLPPLFLQFFPQCAVDPPTLLAITLLKLRALLSFELETVFPHRGFCFPLHSLTADAFALPPDSTLFWRHL